MIYCENVVKILWIYYFHNSKLNKKKKKNSKFKTHLTQPTPTHLINALSPLSSNFFFLPYLHFFRVLLSLLFFLSFSPLSPLLQSSFFLSLLFCFFFFPSFTTLLDLFFCLPLHFDFISPILFVVVLMLVGFGFEDGVATC